MSSPIVSPSKPFVGPYFPPQTHFLSLHPGGHTAVVMPYIWVFLRGGGGAHFRGFDAKWEVFLPFSDFLVDVGGCTSENMGPRSFGRGEFENQGFGLICKSGGLGGSPKLGRFWRKSACCCLFGPYQGQPIFATTLAPTCCSFIGK